MKLISNNLPNHAIQNLRRQMIFFTRRAWPPQTHRCAMVLPPLLSALREGLLHHDHYDHCDHHNHHHNHKRTITINNVICQHWGDQDKEDMHVRSAYSRDKMYLDWSCLEINIIFWAIFNFPVSSDGLTEHLISWWMSKPFLAPRRPISVSFLIRTSRMSQQAIPK